jgi:hypothetical protein
MSEPTEPISVPKADFAGLHEEYARLARAAYDSQEGWAYSLGGFTTDQVAALKADILTVVSAVPPPPGEMWHPPTDPHQYRQAAIWSNHGTDLLHQSTGPVDQVAREVAQGVKSVIGGRWFRFGEELAVTHMTPWTVGRGHRDKGFRFTGNASVGPVKVRIHNGAHSEIIGPAPSLQLVLVSSSWHKFSNPSNEASRGSVSVAIS